jgi:hypothetical protein
MGERVAAVGGEQRRHPVAGARAGAPRARCGDGVVQRLAHLGQREGDELDLDGTLAIDVLVERRRLDV